MGSPQGTRIRGCPSGPFGSSARLAPVAAPTCAPYVFPEANMEAAYVATVRKGKIFNIEYFWDHAEALEAAGLRE